MRNNLHIIIGLPASGKSTYCADMSKEFGGEVISSDSIRKELYGSEECQKNPNKVFSVMRERTIENLNNGKDVWYDATNVRRKDRISFISEIRKRCDVNIVGVVIATPYEVCLARNKTRERVVPEGVIEKFYRRFETPVKNEGFDGIYVCRENFGITYNSLVNEMEKNDTSQDNPHHSLSVLFHCLAAGASFRKMCAYKEVNLRDTSFSNELYRLTLKAIEIHDIGKIFCKTFKNSKGEITDVAHFYNHENCGAYDCLTIEGMPYKEVLFISTLVNNHMVFYKDEKTINNRRELLGEELWEFLKMVHKCDEEGK